MRNAAGADGKHNFVTDATAGSGGGKVAIAGSLALDDRRRQDERHDPVQRRSRPSRAQPERKDLTLSATSVVVSTTKAKAKAEDTGTVGIGAGAAIHSVDVITTASIDPVPITGAKDVSVTASGTTMTTYAEAGAEGASGSTLALTADAAITLADCRTSASIGGAASETLATSGKVTLSATQTAKTTTTAKADAVSGTVVIGLALALAVVKAEATAMITRSVNAGGDVTLTAVGSSANLTNAVASATGAG